MNNNQKHVDDYMTEYLNGFCGYNDFTVKEAWNMIRPLIMDALEEGSL